MGYRLVILFVMASEPHPWLSHRGKHKDSCYWSNHKMEIEILNLDGKVYAFVRDNVKNMTNNLHGVGSEQSKQT